MKAPQAPCLDAESPLFESEDAHEESAIEWWFFQGVFEGDASSPLHFMVCLFRFNVEREENRQGNGFQLFLAGLDADGRHASTTWIDTVLLHKAVEKLKSTKSPLDPAVQRAMAEEFETHGPPAPIVAREAPERFRPAPLDIRWGDFELRQEDSMMHLRFPDPLSGQAVSLVLTPAAPRMKVACSTDLVPLGSGMAYQNYPRIDITGTMGKEAAVTGQAWMDHQWGETSWFRQADTDTILGWDWFGINLDDGSDWLIMRHREAQSGMTVAMHVTTRDADGSLRTAHAVTLTPQRHWESPRTRTDYPVAWKIEVPELDAAFAFEPLADDQEVASFEANRSVWEGAGTVTGTVAGRKVRGRARGEFQGYGCVFDHQDFIGRMARRVDARLEEILPREFGPADVERFAGPAIWEHDSEAYTAAISVPVWDLVDRSGKRWRPIFGILMLEAMGTPSEPYEALLATSELMHAGALIVDDIEDASELRRGEPALHHRYGTDVALNAGNALYFFPDIVVMTHPLLTADQRLAIHEIKARVSVQAHGGQATDIHWSRSLSVDSLRERLEGDIEGRLLQMYALKTAAASSGVAEVAAVVAGVTPDQRRAAAAFGRALGVSFQVIDDIHNFSRSPDWTKTPGEDLACGKLTYVVATALRRLDEPERQRLAAILCDPKGRRDPAILDEGIDLVRGSGALEACCEIAQGMVEEAWTTFAETVPSGESKIMLHAMCLKLIDLAFDA